MAEVLSQQQIDELLGNLSNGNVDFNEIEEQSTKKIKEYDFRSPKKFTREQLKLVDNIFDNFARLFGLHLSSMLRVGCDIQILQVEEEEYKEFNNALDDSVLVGVIGLSNNESGLDDKQILMDISRPVSFCIIDRMLGGDGSGVSIYREYTEIELALMDYLFKQVIVHMENAWANYGDVKHNLDMIETNSRLIQFIPPDEAVVIIVMEIKIGNLVGNITICLPDSTISVLLKLLEQKYVRASKSEDSEAHIRQKQMIMESIETTDLEVVGTLGETQLELRDLLELQPGDIIKLNSSVKTDSIVVNIENEAWFKGNLGMHKKNNAIKISKVVK